MENGKMENGFSVVDPIAESAPYFWKKRMIVTDGSGVHTGYSATEMAPAGEQFELPYFSY